MSTNRGRPPRSGEMRRHLGTVAASYDQGVVDVQCQGLADTVMESLEPVATGPVLWGPIKGQRVVLEEPPSSDAQDQPQVVGLEFDVFADHPWRRENASVLVSPDGKLGVVVDGGTAALEDGGDVSPKLYIGRDEATEPAVLGAALKSFLESLLDDVETMKTTNQSLLDALKVFATSASASTDPVVAAAAGVLNGAIAGLTYASLDFAGKKSTIDDHNSSLVFVSKE